MIVNDSFTLLKKLSNFVNRFFYQKNERFDK